MPYYQTGLAILSRASVMIGIAAIFCAASSCQLAAGEPAGSPPAAAQPAPAAAPAASRLIGEPAPVQPAFEVKLLDAGAEPRRTLRYEVAPGMRQRVDAHLSATTQIRVSGLPFYVERGPNADSRLVVEVVAADGDRLSCQLRVERAEATYSEGHESGFPRERRVSLDKLSGQAYPFATDRRGFVVPSMPEHLPDRDRDRDVAWAILQGTVRSVVPLPEEPVGLGARWQISEESRVGITLSGRMITELELRAIRGRRLELDMKQTIVTPPQLLHLRSDSVGGVSRCRSQSHGRLVIDLGLLAPVERASETEFEFDGALNRLSEALPLHLLVAVSESMSGG
jgi:hypothetical protein